MRVRYFAWKVTTIISHLTYGLEAGRKEMEVIMSVVIYLSPKMRGQFVLTLKSNLANFSSATISLSTVYLQNTLQDIEVDQRWKLNYKIHCGKLFLWEVFIDLPPSVVVLILESLYNYPVEMLGCMLNPELSSLGFWDSHVYSGSIVTGCKPALKPSAPSVALTIW